MLTRIILIGLLCTGWHGLSLAQISLERSVIGASGASFSTAQLQLSATVGETVITTLTAGNISLTQGFQQPEKEDFTTGFRAPELLVGLTLFPNPATDRAQLTLISLRADEYAVTLHDVFGRILSRQTGIRVNSGLAENIPLAVSTLPPGTYYLHLVNSKGQLAGSLPVVVVR